MKKRCILLPAMLFCAGIFSVAGCMSTAPISDTGHFPADSSAYTILGRVEVETTAKKAGYRKLYQAAVEKYPETDDVVNVKIDLKTFNLPFIYRFHFRCYMSGIAISYK